MIILDKDEMYTKDTVDILECLKTDTNLRGDHQVCSCMDKIFNQPPLVQKSRHVTNIHRPMVIELAGLYF